MQISSIKLQTQTEAKTALKKGLRNSEVDAAPPPTPLREVLEKLRKKL